MSAPEISQDVIAAGVYGLRYAAERQHINLHAVDVEAIVRAVLANALARHYVLRTDLMKQVAAEKARTQTVMTRACAAENERDRYLGRIGKVITDLAETDPETARRLASSLGIYLLPDKDSP